MAKVIKMNLSRQCFASVLFISLFMSGVVGQVQADWPAQMYGVGSGKREGGTSISQYGIGHVYVSDNAVDSVGNSYVTGWFNTTMSFPRKDQAPFILNALSTNPRDYFLTKYDAAGNFVWAKRFGFSGDNHYRSSVDTDNQDNVYLSTYWVGADGTNPDGSARPRFNTGLYVYKGNGDLISNSVDFVQRYMPEETPDDQFYPTGVVRFSLAESTDQTSQIGYQMRTKTIGASSIPGGGNDQLEIAEVRKFRWVGGVFAPEGPFIRIPPRVYYMYGVNGPENHTAVKTGGFTALTENELCVTQEVDDHNQYRRCFTMSGGTIDEHYPKTEHFDEFEQVQNLRLKASQVGLGVYHYGNSTRNNEWIVRYTNFDVTSENFTVNLEGYVVGTTDLVVDTEGNAIISGRFGSRGDTTPNTLVFNDGGSDAPITLTHGSETTNATATFVAKLSKDGEWLWATQVNKTHHFLAGHSLALNPNGTTAYLAANYWRRADFVGSDSAVSLYTSTHTNGYIMPLETQSGNWLIPKPIKLGESISPPLGAEGEPLPVLQPIIYVGGEEVKIGDFKGTLYWSDHDNVLYVTGALNSVIELKWRLLEQPETIIDEDGFTTVVDGPWGPLSPSQAITYEPSLRVDIHSAGTSVNLEPAYAPEHSEDAPKLLRFVGVQWPKNDHGVKITNNVFKRNELAPGTSDFVVLHYTYVTNADSTPDPSQQRSFFQVVETKEAQSFIEDGTEDCYIGSELISGNHYRPDSRNGHIVNARARYDASLYEPETDLGRIIPVNKSVEGIEETQMDVVWYTQNDMGQSWSDTPRHYNCGWPAAPIKAMWVSDQEGSGDLGETIGTNVRSPSIYYQNDPALPGFNANEEHALIYNNRVYALRSDLNDKLKDQDPEMASEKYVLLKYEDSSDENRVKFGVFRSYTKNNDKPFAPNDSNDLYRLEVGKLLQAPAPLTRLGVNTCPGTKIIDPDTGLEINTGTNKVGWEDYQRNFWARSEGEIWVRYQYPLQEGFFFDFDEAYVSEGAKEIGECVSWLAYHPDTDETPPKTPIDVTFGFEWPRKVPTMAPGETLFDSKIVECAYENEADKEDGDVCNLPMINGQAAAEIIFDTVMHGPDAVPDLPPADSLLKLFDPLSARSVDLEELPPLVTTFDREGVLYFTQLPFVLRSRLSYDPINNFLSFKGTFDDSQIGDPHLLPNIMTARERDRINELSSNSDFQAAVEALYHKTRNPNGLDLSGYYVGRPDGNPDQAYLVGLQPTYIGTGIDSDGDGRADDYTDNWDGESVKENPDGTPNVTTNGIDDRLDNEELLKAGEFIAPAVDITQAASQALNGTPMALSAGRARNEGYVTLAFNNDAEAGNPVSLQVIKVDKRNGVYQGNIWIVPSDNVFDESLTLRHSGDFAGDPDQIEFDWYYQPDTDGQAEAPRSFAADDADRIDLLPVPSPWIRHPDSGIGAIDITLEGPGLLTLSDNWFITRYKGLGTDPGDDGMDVFDNKDIPSPWAGDPSYERFAETSNPAVEAKAMLAEGWIKRVIGKLNVFDQRVSDFHTSEVNTLTSMIAQAGEPYAGPIPFNPDPDVINSVGIIEAYQTVLDRGKDLSIGSGFNDIAANTQLLNAATRIADLYMLLGNEAYADGQDPTIGFDTNGEMGTLASSLFAFQNQLESPLEEELILLRGRDDSRAGTAGHPVNNRLFWNFTQGTGEVAYVKNYRITDQNADGFINETDARMLYPQGHGDAWGHYLTSVKNRYLLMKEDNFTWKPRTESVLVAGVPLEIDYLDERKFAAAAAAKARTGVEVIDLTYRNKYVESPAGQWQGYKDTKEITIGEDDSGNDMTIKRAWGLDGWGRRAAQGAYFDWLTANAILPHEDPNPEHEGIEKIDRTTVPELGQIVAGFTDIQAQLDKADAGLNPLGLAKGVVPFDIAPYSRTLGSASQGGNHFDQISARAQVALDNAVRVFDHANQQTQSLRYVQDDVDQITNTMAEQELDYKNRLIEIFGYPYVGDIGGGKTYPSGYNGPDLYHYQYVNSELVGGLPELGSVKTGYYTGMAFGGENFHFFPEDLATFAGAFTNVGEDFLEVHYPVSGQTGASQGAEWKFIAPKSWGKRRAPGELQNAISGNIQAQAALQMAIKNHENLLEDIQDAGDLIAAEYQLNIDNIRVLTEQRNKTIGLNKAIGVARFAQGVAATYATLTEAAADAGLKSIPTVVGFANDAFSALRGAGHAIKATAASIFHIAANASGFAADSLELRKEAVSLQTDIRLETDTLNVALKERIKVLEQLWRQEAVLRLELLTQQEVVQQSMGNYFEVLARGQRVMEARRAFRVATAGDVQAHRYSDMSFRIFRNDALQKYRAHFDLAARYVYLAATAYDYETNLLGDGAGSGSKFLADIVRQRSLGQVIDGVPVAGTQGLADVLARLNQNFDLYRGQLGFNNPQIETNRFSLRKELFRLAGNDEQWRKTLEQARVSNLWDDPDFKRYVRPFAPESLGAQPGLVIEFPTTVSFGQNFFGNALGGGDSAYDPTNFATKIRAVGTWFSNYDGTGLSNTPRVYLVPVGMDVLRSPDGDNFETREWRVVDQKLPAPFQIGASDLDNPDWIPANDSLSDTYADIRRMSSYRAYHDSGEYDPSEAVTDSRLVGRSVWNTRWKLIIPGGTLNWDSVEGLDRLIHGEADAQGIRDGNGITDILLHFQTYGFSGN